MPEIAVLLGILNFRVRLWLPGTDHASIATEVKVVEQIKAEGESKESLGREKFLERVWAWKDKYCARIVQQLKKLGSSCDWSRLTFTMDEKCSKAVREVFVNLYNKNSISACSSPTMGINLLTTGRITFFPIKCL